MQGTRGIGALTTACVHPAYRNPGWGVEVMQAAFDYLPKLGGVALF